MKDDPSHNYSIKSWLSDLKNDGINFSITIRITLIVIITCVAVELFISHSESRIVVQDICLMNDDFYLQAGQTVITEHRNGVTVLKFSSSPNYIRSILIGTFIGLPMGVRKSFIHKST